MTTPAPLHDCTIIITRPAGQAGVLASMLEQAGACTVDFPTIEIRPADNRGFLLDQLQNLHLYDYAIFISRNAVEHGIELVWQALGKHNWPPATRIAVIGNGSRSVLGKHGLEASITPSGIPNSENLLLNTAMQQVDGKKILIFRGNGGREKLADTLRARGATVDYLECYRRTMPELGADILHQVWNDGNRHGCIVTSREGLLNLYQMVAREDLKHLNTTPLFVVSQAMVETAIDLGYRLTPVLMRSAANDDVLESVIAYFSKNPV